MHMHLRELMFHHKVVEIATLTRQYKPTSKPPPGQANIGACSRRDAPLPADPAATSPPRPADPPQRMQRTADGEALDAGSAVRHEQRRPMRPSTEDLLEACAPARPAAAATPRNGNRPGPAPPGGNLFIDADGGDGWASARAAEMRGVAGGSAGRAGIGISASVGELAHGGRFQPLLLT